MNTQEWPHDTNHFTDAVALFSEETMNAESHATLIVWAFVMFDERNRRPSSLPTRKDSSKGGCPSYVKMWARWVAPFGHQHSPTFLVYSVRVSLLMQWRCLAWLFDEPDGESIRRALCRSCRCRTACFKSSSSIAVSVYVKYNQLWFQKLNPILLLYYTS